MGSDQDLGYTKEDQIRAERDASTGIGSWTTVSRPAPKPIEEEKALEEVQGNTEDTEKTGDADSSTKTTEVWVWLEL